MYTYCHDIFVEEEEVADIQTQLKNLSNEIPKKDDTIKEKMDLRSIFKYCLEHFKVDLNEPRLRRKKTKKPKPVQESTKEEEDAMEVDQIYEELVDKEEEEKSEQEVEKPPEKKSKVLKKKKKKKPPSPPQQDQEPHQDPQPTPEPGVNILTVRRKQ